jgi:hypothetical protein
LQAFPAFNKIKLLSLILVYHSLGGNRCQLIFAFAAEKRKKVLSGQTDQKLSSFSVIKLSELSLMMWLK